MNQNYAELISGHITAILTEAGTEMVKLLLNEVMSTYQNAQAKIDSMESTLRQISRLHPGEDLTKNTDLLIFINNLARGTLVDIENTGALH